jgi:hypothetical protein
MLETDNQAQHVAPLQLGGLSTGKYLVSHGGEQVASMNAS